jgi:hypothetical protein
MLLYIQSITFLSFAQGERRADASVSAGPPDPAQSEEPLTLPRESESSLQTSAAAAVAMTPKSPTLPPHLLDKRRLADNPPPGLNRSHSSAPARQPSGGFANQQQPTFRFDSGEHVPVPSTAGDVSAEQNSPEKSPMLPKHLLDRSRLNQPAPSIRKGIDSSGQPSVVPTAGPVAREQPATSSDITNDEQAPTPSPKPRPPKTTPAAQQHAVRTGAADSGSPQTAAASLIESEIDQALPQVEEIPAGETPAIQTTTGGEPEGRNEGLEEKTSTSEAAASEFTLQPVPSPRPKPKPRPRPHSPRPVASAAEPVIDHWPPPAQLSTLGVDCDQSKKGLSEMNTGSPATSKVQISPSPKPRPPPPKAFD